MRIGLIAMSGIRACDAELLRLGLTLPGFVNRSRVIASLPSLGLLTLAGMTPQEHDVEYIEVPDLAKLGELPDRFDLVAISSYSAQIREAYDLAMRYREIDIPVVIGGPHVTACPEEAAGFCDAVVVGEGEVCWREVVRDCGNGRLQRRYGSRDCGFDLVGAPMPAFELLDPSKYNRLTIQTSRGCPHCCDFCASSPLLTGRYKQKSAEKVMAEIDRILEIWQHPFIEFADDNSFVDKAYWKNLLPALAERRVHWFAESDISLSEDDDLLKLLFQSGCVQVLIGLESPIEADLKNIELRTDWKWKRWRYYREAIRKIQSYGIAVNGCFVLGLDGQGIRIFNDIFRFVEETEMYEVQVTILTPFPGTPLYARLQAEDRISEPGHWEKCTLFDVNFRPKGMTADELSEGFRSLVAQLYSREFTDWRRSRFTPHLRAQYQARSRRTNEQ